MAETTSRSRVTITLGRSGQVVKRAGPMLDGGFSEPQVGSKRSVRDRLGSDMDGILLNNKRQRGDSNRMGTHSFNGGDDMRLGKDDLRFKLMRKNVLGRGQSDVPRNGVDLRETLSRAVGHSTISLSMRQRMPEQAGDRHIVPERKDASMLGQYPSTRSAKALFQMDSRNSYSPWTLDQLGRRSPDEVLRNPRNLSPQRNDEDIMRRPFSRTYDDARTVSYMSRAIHEPGRPLSTAPYMTKPTVAPASRNPAVLPIAPPPQMGGIVHRSSYTGNDHLTVEGLLRSLGLQRYAISFKAEEVDMTALRQMGDKDLKDLGIPMGPRKKILLALLPRSKRLL